MVEVYEHKYGYNPRTEGMTGYVRRRFHLVQGGNPQLWLIHYLRAPDEGTSSHQASFINNRPSPSHTSSTSIIPAPPFPTSQPLRNKIHNLTNRTTRLI